ncbi:MAG: hypothetical protein KKB50_21410 [Planctomycetes bacterium]|nr:hypothetical protein [Planctomycetota bacterium]
MGYALTACVVMFLAQQPQAEVGTGPEPSPNPISWELEFKFLAPRRLEVQLPGHDQPEVYWYMVYTVTNTSNRTQRFFPTFQLVTEDLTVIDTDMGISPLVFNAIKERHKITHPYLVHPTKAIGELRVGDDNARESVAIWRQIDANLNSFIVYVAGLSGETRFVRNPAYDSSQPETANIIGPDGRERELVINPKHFTLRKTLEIRYTLPGSPQSRRLVEPRRVGTRWIMR